jgi:hypothetical protein
LPSQEGQSDCVSATSRKWKAVSDHQSFPLLPHLLHLSLDSYVDSFTLLTDAEKILFPTPRSLSAAPPWDRGCFQRA